MRYLPLLFSMVQSPAVKEEQDKLENRGMNECSVFCEEKGKV